MNDIAVAAGIVTYNPDAERLKENIESILKQVSELCIVDNGSGNLNEIEETAKYYSVKLIVNDKNLGIAAALNQIMMYTKECEMEWCVTLDQDSIAPDNLINEAAGLLNNKEIGQIVPVIYEAQADEYCYLGHEKNGKSVQEVTKGITSASVYRVSAWEKCGRFDEDLFIDYVDYDFSMRLRLKGYKIYRLNNAVLTHEIGNSFSIRFLGKKIRVGNHSAFRKYYIGRNIILFIHRYKREAGVSAEYLRLLKVFLLLPFEKNRAKKFNSLCKGIWDGARIARMGSGE